MAPSRRGAATAAVTAAPLHRRSAFISALLSSSGSKGRDVTYGVRGRRRLVPTEGEQEAGLRAAAIFPLYDNFFRARPLVHDRLRFGGWRRVSKSRSNSARLRLRTSVRRAVNSSKVRQ